MTNKPVAEACLRNQQPIYEVLAPYLSEENLRIFELGSGTGQHAVYLANHLPNVTWQPSDVEACMAGITSWVRDAKHGNVLEPVILDANRADPATLQYDVTFTANTIHFVSETTASNIIRCAAERLAPEGYFFIYGPFKDQGAFTSDSDERFEQWLKGRDPESGIKDFQWVEAIANQNDMVFEQRYAMPANNFILVYRKAANKEQTGEA